MSKAFLFARLVAILLLLAGSAVLTGWQTNNESLTRLIAGLAPMMPNTAVGFLIYGITLYLITTPRTSVSKKVYGCEQRHSTRIIIRIGIIGIQ